MVADDSQADADDARRRSLSMLAAGGFGGACLCIVGSPFDVVKTRLQQNSAPTSALQAATSIVKAEGIRGFWRGVTPPLLVSVPQFAVVFAAYEAARTFVRRHSDGKHGTRDTAIAGMLVAVPTSFIYTPVDRVKLALQSDGRRIATGLPAQYSSVLDCVRRLWSEHGAATFARGFWATLARDAPAWATYFAVYSAVKLRLAKQQQKQPQQQSDAGVLDGSVELSPIASLVAGGLAGAATWAVCVPMDVVKTRFQTDLTHTTYRAACRSIMRASGVGGFFAGFGTIVLGGVPRDAACLAGTEAAQRALTLYGKDARARASNNTRVAAPAGTRVAEERTA